MKLHHILFENKHPIHETADDSQQPVRVEKPFDIPLPADLLKISNIFKLAGKQLYLVGGSVRDALMGKQPKDYDVASDATPDQIIEIFRKHPEFKILEIGKAFGVIKIITPEKNEYEVATFRTDIGKGRRPDSVEFTSIEKDVQRRDLTINALFYDIEGKKIVDYVGGIQDIEQGVVRAVGNPKERFDEDRLRILRALRFAGRMGSKLDPASSEAIKEDNSLAGVSGERIRDEFIKGITSAKSVPYFFGLVEEYNLWPQIFPGLSVNTNYKETKNVPVQLALLLKDNDPKSLPAKLNKLKYPATEVSQVSFLVLFQTLTTETAYKLKKLFVNAHLSNEDLEEFASYSGKPEMNLVNAFKKYELSVGGAELQSQFTGKALGDEIQRRETELFNGLLETTNISLNETDALASAIMFETYWLEEVDYPPEFDKNKFNSLSHTGKIKYLKPLMTRLGSGSSRVVFQLDPNTVLKVAKNEKGMAQNNVETDVSRTGMGSGVTAKIFDYDEDGNWVEMERAQKLKTADFKAATGMSFEKFTELMWYWYSTYRRSYGTIKREAPPEFESFKETEFFGDLLDLIVNYDMPVGDIVAKSSWGTVTRDGKQVPVLVDYGLTQSVKDQYYTPTLRQRY